LLGLPHPQAQIAGTHQERVPTVRRAR